MKHSKEYYWNKYYYITGYDEYYANWLKENIRDVFRSINFNSTYTNLLCPICGVECSGVGHIFSHTSKKMHIRIKKDTHGGSLYPRCPYCNRTRFDSELSLLFHIKHMHPDKYTDKHEMVFTHLMNVESGELVKKIKTRPFYKCPHCDYAFSTYAEREAHIKIEHPQRSYKKKYPLKPWKDEESLFCDKDFLEKYLNKEIALGDECKE